MKAAGDIPMSDEALNTDDGNEDFEDEFQKIAEGKDNISELELDDEVLPGDDLEEEPEPIIASEEEVIKPVEEELDPYAGMDEATANHFKAIEQSNKDLQHRIKSDDGRVSTFQKQVNALNERLASMEKPEVSKEDIAEAMSTGEKWDEFKEDYPDIAEAFDERLNAAISNQNEHIDTTLAPVIQQKAYDDMEDGYNKVAEVYPEWQNAVKEVHFDEWLTSQPAAVQTLAESDDAKDASSLIGLYDNHRIANKLPSLKVAPDDDLGGDEIDTATELELKRQRQLDAGMSVPSRNARIVTSGDETGDTFTDAFAAYAKRKDAKRA